MLNDFCVRILRFILAFYTKTAPVPLRQRRVLYPVIILIRHEQMNNEGYGTAITNGGEIRSRERKIQVIKSHKHT